MTRTMKWVVVNLVLTAAVAALPALGAQNSSANRPSPPPHQPGSYLKQAVGHQLRLLPYYSLFDNLEYKIDGYHVTLLGQVVRPTLKSEAENVVKKIEGVQGVTNHIQVLPVSPMDHRIRLAEYRAIYGQPTLNRYALQAVPPIHIIVDNGHVTLVGVVADQMDKNVAGIQAKTVHGVFSVTNDLRVEK
ncbi:MAG: BON domain-containing protein [Terriglobia bacterium]